MIEIEHTFDGEYECDTEEAKQLQTSIYNACAAYAGYLYRCGLIQKTDGSISLNFEVQVKPARLN